MNRLVDFSFGDVVKIHSSQLDEFKTIALNNDEKKRYRLCLQDSPANQLHDMFLCRTRGDYLRPDKHINCPESHTIIEGTEAIILFSDAGDIKDAFILNRESEYLTYRINGDVYHMTIPLTEVAIDYEVKLGPFTPSNNIFPDWAPDGTNLEEVKAFLCRVEKEMQLYLGEVDGEL